VKERDALREIVASYAAEAEQAIEQMRDESDAPLDDADDDQSARAAAAAHLAGVQQQLTLRDAALHQLEQNVCVGVVVCTGIVCECCFPCFMFVAGGCREGSS
jgi:23S rRNA G2445 N2-methylase RlmL